MFDNLKPTEQLETTAGVETRRVREVESRGLQMRIGGSLQTDREGKLQVMCAG